MQRGRGRPQPCAYHMQFCKDSARGDRQLAEVQNPRRDLELLRYLGLNKKQPKGKKDIKYKAIAATIYNARHETNQVEFYKVQGNAQEVIKHVKEQVR